MDNVVRQVGDKPFPPDSRTPQGSGVTNDYEPMAWTCDRHVDKAIISSVPDIAGVVGASKRDDDEIALTTLEGANGGDHDRCTDAIAKELLNGTAMRLIRANDANLGNRSSADDETQDCAVDGVSFS